MLLGEMLGQLRAKNIMILGSGMTFHNMQLLFNPQDTTTQKASSEFNQWLDETLGLEETSARAMRLADWESAPSAKWSHPREEHLIPLHVCSGVAGNKVD